MSAVMALYLPLFKLRWQPDFAAIWWGAVVAGMAISFPSSLRVIPIIHKYVSKAFVEARQ